MAGGGKLFVVGTVLFGLCSIMFFALSVTSIQKYQGQKQRVHHMEQKILAGKKEILKVPEMIGKLRLADKEIVDKGVEIADLTEANEELTGELAELQKEFTLVSVARAVLEIDKAGYTKNVIEARQAVEELRNQMSTNDGGARIHKSVFSNDLIQDATIEDIHEETHQETSEETHNEEGHTEYLLEVSSQEDVTELQRTLNSIRNQINSSDFMYAKSTGNYSDKLVNLISKAEKQSEASPELHQLIKDFAGKLATPDPSMSVIFGSFDAIQSAL